MSLLQMILWLPAVVVCIVPVLALLSLIAGAVKGNN